MDSLRQNICRLPKNLSSTSDVEMQKLFFLANVANMIMKLANLLHWKTVVSRKDENIDIMTVFASNKSTSAASKIMINCLLYTSVT